MKITQLPSHWSVIGSVPEKKLKVSDYFSRKLLKLIYETETVYGLFEWTIKRVNTGTRLVNPGYFEYNSFDKNLWNAWSKLNSNLSGVVVLLVRSTFKITPHNLQSPSKMAVIIKKRKKNPKPSGGDIVFSSYQFVRHKLLYAPLLHFEREFLKTLPASLLPYKESTIDMAFWSDHLWMCCCTFYLWIFHQNVFCQKQPLIVIKMGSVAIVIFPIIIS